MPLMIFVSDVGCGCPVRLIRTSSRLGDVTVGATSRSYSCVGLRWFSNFLSSSMVNHHEITIWRIFSIFPTTEQANLSTVHGRTPAPLGMYQMTCFFVLSPISFNVSSISTGWPDFWIIWLRRTTSCGVIQWLPQFVTWTSLRCHFNFSTMRFITIWNRNMFDMFGLINDFSHLLARPKFKLEKGWISSLDGDNFLQILGNKQITPPAVVEMILLLMAEILHHLGCMKP